MIEWKELPLSGISCTNLDGSCTIWWTQSQKVDKRIKTTKSIRVDMPDYKVIAGTLRKAELKLSDILKDSKLRYYL